MLGDFLKASDLPYSSSLARVPSRWLLAHRPTPIATPWQHNRLDSKCALLWNTGLRPGCFSDFLGYLSFHGIIVSRCEQDFLQLFLHHFFIETLLENHSDALIQETLKKDNSLKFKRLYFTSLWFLKNERLGSYLLLQSVVVRRQVSCCLSCQLTHPLPIVYGSQSLGQQLKTVWSDKFHETWIY